MVKMSGCNGTVGIGAKNKGIASVMCLKMVLALLLVTPGVTCAGQTFDLREEMPGNTYVGNVTLEYSVESQLTSDQRNSLIYELIALGNSYTHFFRIVNTTGELFTTGPIDRDGQICSQTASGDCVLSLTILVYIADSAFYEVIHINISIKDVNDNTPVFLTNVETVHIPENVPIGTTILIASAKDIDGGNFSIMKYYMDSPDAPFTMNGVHLLNGSFVVEITVRETLDREQRDFYKLRIVAEDGGIPTRTGTLEVNVSISDANDNVPVFEKDLLYVTLSEDVPVGTIVVAVKATDVDMGMNAQIGYRLDNLNSPEVIGMFAIDSLSGEVRVVNQLENSTDYIIIYVEAFDHGEISLLSEAVVNISVIHSINNPPEISVYALQGSGEAANISEFATSGAEVASIHVTDTDTGRDGRISCMTNNDYFSVLRYDNNIFKLVVSKIMDRELKAIHDVEIICQDSGSPPLNSTTHFTVIVLDENDNAPLFKPPVYHTSIVENSDIETVVVVVTASDKDIGENARITYHEILDNPDFEIGHDTGIITLTGQLDREIVTEIAILVEAVDHGIPSLTSTTTVFVEVVDVNDNSPVFSASNYEFNVRENVLYNSSVGQVNAVDMDYQDNGSIKFSFGRQPSSKFPFALFSDGSIHVVRNLERDSQSLFVFTVKASDRGVPSLSSTATVTVHVI